MFQERMGLCTQNKPHLYIDVFNRIGNSQLNLGFPSPMDPWLRLYVYNNMYSVYKDTYVVHI